MDNRAIGVFDTGLGGLTVFKAIMEDLPGESLIYFGDSGRTPYGTKSSETIIKYTLQNIRFLTNQNIKMLVMACNTMSAYGYEIAKENFEGPVVEVIGAGAKAAVAGTKNRKLGIIGTPATINSGAYKIAINKLENNIDIIQKACPLFVPLAEEGRDWWRDEITYRVAEKYLSPLKKEGIDTLVLGCTHYPLLQDVIGDVMGPAVNLISSAREVAGVVKDTIANGNIQRDVRKTPEYHYFTSDSTDKFMPLCSMILGITVDNAKKIDIEKY